MYFSKLAGYSENNRIEAKRATGGFPQSVWETYSAFANTLGGVILLGVAEGKDHSLTPVSLPDPSGLAAEFWRLVNDKKTVNINVLTRGQVCVEVVDGKKIVVVRVPRATRLEKPVYVGTNPFTGSYKRNGEGDYKCSREEVAQMLEEGRRQTPDMRLLPLSVDGLCRRSMQSYKKRVETARPQVFASGEDEEFFTQVGALGRGADGTHPTAAGLLLFGKNKEICKVFPRFRLEYRENGELILLGKNAYTFYFAAGERLAKGFPSAIKKALLEGLANGLMNADYTGGEIVVSRNREEITLSNPGGFSIALEQAKRGGLAEPNNEGVTRLFRLMGVGNGAGSGIPHIYEIWRSSGFAAPSIIEERAPARITLRLPLRAGAWENRPLHGELQRELVLNRLTARSAASEEELVSLLGDLSSVESLLDEGLIVKMETGYKLKR